MSTNRVLTNPTIHQVKMWYERVQASSETLDELPSMNPLQLTDIARDNSYLNFDWRSLDSFFAEGSTWSAMWAQ